MASIPETLQRKRPNTKLRNTKTHEQKTMQITQICQECGEQFKAHKSNRKFCGKKCFMARYNRLSWSDPEIRKKRITGIIKAQTGKTWEERLGKEKAEQRKAELIQRIKSSPGKNKGRKLSERWRRNIGLAVSEIMNNPEYFKKWLETQKTPEHRARLSKKASERVGAKNPAWIDGRSFLPYAPEFNKKLKKEIREKHNHECALCRIKIMKNLPNDKQFLCIHHIDHDKHNNKEHNLITLCNSCNIKVNHNQEFWEKQLKQIMVESEKDGCIITDIGSRSRWVSA